MAESKQPIQTGQVGAWLVEIDGMFRVDPEQEPPRT